VWFFATLLFIVIAVAVAGFGIANADRVIPELMLWDLGFRRVLADVNLAQAMLVAFASGALLTLLVEGVRGARDHTGRRALEKRIRELEHEVVALRTLPLDDSLPRIVDGEEP